MTIVTLGIDLGKNLNSVVGLDAEGQVVLRRRVRRATLAEMAGRLAPCSVAMEACCGAHHIGRLFAAKGHKVRLMSPDHVRPYVRAQKNDDNDAVEIAEAATRSTMRFVELKSQDRLDLQTLHRVRSRLVAARKALVNQLRAILLERGHTFRQGRKVRRAAFGPFDPHLDAHRGDARRVAITRSADRCFERRSDRACTWSDRNACIRKRFVNQPTISMNGWFDSANEWEPSVGIERPMPTRRRAG